ncbi:DUF72 domain-containing protein [Candidatus Cyanaurora vandensis]|uniref:DUF72 domain-containing protein n=1 Tax=Candidatus Cyanaurora vandensis TaxID=2714958 RepID=UPI00257EA49F|nr:DUF72 domain-containing protein [Candidatus Cyanaurora vandensis]
MIRVGCQGWRYPDWRKPGVQPFYPAHLPPAQELTAYSQTFNLVEVDSTFYAIPSAAVVEQWRDQTTPDFRFTLKLPRALTHEARLRRGRETLLTFCERAQLLGPRLAAILIQLPPSFGIAETPVLSRFLPHLPDLPFAIEFRDPQWLNPQTQELLARYNVAWTLGETPWLSTDLSTPWLEQVKDWVYVRIMGQKEGGLTQFTHLQIDRDQALTTWAGSLQRLAERGVRAWVLVDNHFQGFSPGTATLLKHKLKLPEYPFPSAQPPPIEQLTLPL